jgi:hypothetical protein
LDSFEDQTSNAPAEELNYFNYFTEVEEEFVRRRGKPLLVSPLDWALIESWKNSGIPLHIALRGINEAFDARDKRAPKHQRVNSLLYCEPQVEATFAAYRLAQVGATSEPEAPPDAKKEKKKKRKGSEQAFPKESLLEFISRCGGELDHAYQLALESSSVELPPAIMRARARLTEIAAEIESSARIEGEALERDLDSIDRMLMETAASSDEEKIQALRKEAEKQLRGYRKKMDEAIYEQTVQNFVARRLREMHALPRLSLFYL